MRTVVLTAAVTVAVTLAVALYFANKKKDDLALIKKALSLWHSLDTVFLTLILIFNSPFAAALLGDTVLRTLRGISRRRNPTLQQLPKGW